MNRAKQIKNLWSKGLSTRAIARKLSVSPNTISYWLKKLNLKSNIAPPGERAPIEDLSGKRFGKLVVEKMVKSGPRGSWSALCHCDCGTKNKILPRRVLVEGITTSCGCRTDYYAKLTGENSSQYVGYKEIRGTFWNKTISRHTKKKYPGIPITIKEAWDLYEKQDRKCALSGLPISFGRVGKSKENTASLDRINPAFGYTKDNVQWVKKEINYMKHTLSQEEFINFCRLVADRN